MSRVYDWLVQHHDQRDTGEYRASHDWLAEQMGLSPDTLEPSRRSNPNSNAGSESPPVSEPTAKVVATLAAIEAPDAASFTAEVASVGTLALVEAADIASFTVLKKRKRGAGNKPKLTKEQAIELQQALRNEIKRDPTVRKHEVAIAWLQHQPVRKIKTKDGKELVVSPSTLYRRMTRWVLGPRHRAGNSDVT